MYEIDDDINEKYTNIIEKLMEYSNKKIIPQENNNYSTVLHPQVVSSLFYLIVNPIIKSSIYNYQYDSLLDNIYIGEKDLDCLFDDEGRALNSCSIRKYCLGTVPYNKYQFKIDAFTKKFRIDKQPRIQLMYWGMKRGFININDIINSIKNGICILECSDINFAGIIEGIIYGTVDCGLIIEKGKIIGMVQGLHFSLSITKLATNKTFIASKERIRLQDDKCIMPYLFLNDICFF